MSTLQIEGFEELFSETVLDEFIHTVFRTKFYEALIELHADLNAWLVHYYTKRPHQGFRNMGRRSMVTINEYLESIIQMSGIPDPTKENTKTVRNDT